MGGGPEPPGGPTACRPRPARPRIVAGHGPETTDETMGGSGPPVAGAAVLE